MGSGVVLSKCFDTVKFIHCKFSGFLRSIRKLPTRVRVLITGEGICGLLPVTQVIGTGHGVNIWETFELYPVCGIPIQPSICATTHKLYVENREGLGDVAKYRL